MVYVYFDQYRHASDDEKIALRNKFFKASNHYELTDRDKQKIATGEYKIEYAKDTQKIPTPPIVLIVVFLVYYGLNGLLKKYIKDIVIHCQLLFGLHIVYIKFLTEMIMTIFVTICLLWYINISHKKALQSGYLPHIYKKNIRFILYKKKQSRRYWALLLSKKRYRQKKSLLLGAILMIIAGLFYQLNV